VIYIFLDNLQLGILTDIFINSNYPFYKILGLTYKELGNLGVNSVSDREKIRRAAQKCLTRHDFDLEFQGNKASTSRFFRGEANTNSNIPKIEKNQKIIPQPSP
jgi:hypothetical protein